MTCIYGKLIMTNSTWLFLSSRVLSVFSLFLSDISPHLMDDIANAKIRVSAPSINSTLKVMDFDKLDSNPEFKSVYSNSKTAKSYIKRTVSKW